MTLPRLPDDIDGYSGTVAAVTPLDDRFGGTMASSGLPQPNARTQSPTVLVPALAESEAGKMVGAYRLLRKLGEGGMGDVWIAEQPDPQREVALKRVKSVAASPYVLQKFEAERQILALMDHPNIARVIDGGTSERGEPFYVMELVSGLPLNEYCDRHRLTIRNRLLLFRDICAGVQHAHMKGIVHRDLKPANILVAEYDGRAVPKIIDFGIARVRSGSHANVEETMSGAVVGTLEYMSPEQASGQQDIDTRADVWSLGVILYELLTGSTPFRHKLRQTALVEALRIICQEEPTRPGTQVSTSHSTAELAASRQVDVRQLARVIQGDPEWIVMKALEKDRARRYDSPSAMSEDIRRHLEDEPVLAGPPTRRYRLKKFLKKHRSGVAFAACVFLLLVVGMATSTWQMVRAGRAEAQARVALDHESDARGATQVALTLAEEERREAVTAREEAVVATEAARVARDAARASEKLARSTAEFMVGIFRNPDPDTAGREIRVADLLEMSTKDLSANESLDPIARAELIEAIASTWAGLGEPKKVVTLREQALALRTANQGADHSDSIKSRALLGWAHHKAGDNPAALPHLERAAADAARLFGPDDPQTVGYELRLGFVLTYSDQIPRGIALMERVLERRRAAAGDDHNDTLTAINNLAVGYRQNRDYPRAIALLEECLARSRSKRGPDHPSTLLYSTNLANFYRDQKAFDKAIPLYEDGFERRKRVQGPAHPSVLSSAGALASACRDDRQYAKAVAPFEFCLKASRASNGDDHPTTLGYLDNLAFVLKQSGQPKAAIPLYEEHLERRKKLHGDDYPALADHQSSAANCYQDVSDYKKSMPLYERSLHRRRVLQGDSHPGTLQILGSLSTACWGNGDYLAAVCYLEESLAARRAEAGGSDNTASLWAIATLASRYEALGDFARGVELYEELLRRREATLGASHADTLLAVDQVANIYARVGRTPESLAFRRRFLDSYRGAVALNSFAATQEHWQYACHLNREGKHAEAVALLSPYLEEVVKEKVLAASRLAGCQVELGLAKLALGETKESALLLETHFPTLSAAAPQLYSGYRPSLIRAAEGMVKLYEATGEQKKLEEAKVRAEGWKRMYGGK